MLVHSFNNFVESQTSRLKLEITILNSSDSPSWSVTENDGGSYSCWYQANDVGTHEICVSFDGNRLLPCPMKVNVYRSEYFPRANNDWVAVWEDESIAFGVTPNDYFLTGNTSMVEFSKPSHGSLVEYGQLFRYTPYKGYYGDDFFLYTISDGNANFATGAVYISVLITPPQFVSFPSQLLSTEDTISPRFGGGGCLGLN